MAEIPEICAASWQFLQKSILFDTKVKALYDKVEDAPEEFKSQRYELESLQRFVATVRDDCSVQTTGIKTTIQKCTVVSERLCAIFDELDFEQTDSIDHKTWESIQGLAKEPEIRYLFVQLGRLKASLNFLISLANSGQEQRDQIAEDIHKIHKIEFCIQPGTEEDRCLQALYVTNPIDDRTRLIATRGERTPGTCEWILSTEEYQAWEQSQSGLLWILGSPGKGKTVLSLFLSHHLEAISRKSSDCIAIYFFCDNKVASRNTAVNILRGLMYQLIQQNNYLIDNLLSHWKARQEYLFGDYSFEGLWASFQAMLDELRGQSVSCVLDGLDECDTSSILLLLSKFGALFGSKAPGQNFKLIVLSRRYPKVLPLSSFPQIQLDGSQGDIEIHLSHCIEELAVEKGIAGPSLRERIQKVFRDRSQGSFLWVSLMSQEIEETAVDDIEASLKQLPRGLDAVYERIVSRIDSNTREAVFKMLYRIALAARPLTVRELCALAQIQPTKHLSREHVCESYIKSCGQLLQLVQGDLPQSPKVVNFVHQSAKDFLLTANRDPKTDHCRVNLKQEHQKMSTVLIECLDRDLRDPHIEPEEREREYPIRLYALAYLGHHLRGTDDTIMEIVRQNPRFFFAPSSILRDRWIGPECNDGGHSSLLHFACHFGLYHLVKHLVMKRKVFTRVGLNRDFNSSTWGSLQQTPLHLACKVGDERIVKLLLECGADLRLEDRAGETALHCAVSYRQRHIFDLLVSTKRGSKIVKDEISGEPPKYSYLLFCAIMAGDEDLCGLLIEKYHFNVDVRDIDGRLPICAAISAGHWTLARVLALRWKAMVDPVAMLVVALATLTRDWNIDINACDDEGDTVLHCHVNQLLILGFDPGQPNKRGKTPLHSAFCSLADKCVKINARDDLGRTILHEFVRLERWQRFGHEALCTLLDFGADRQVRDTDGYTAYDILQQVISGSLPGTYGIEFALEILEDYATVPVDPAVVTLYR
ncbi:hypothetical protein EDB80DRAFT_814338 [Ilyonectria destructans]|nr:hypothetical protein EDB80DRAFT_814338 [Ilyonectria destructans]